MATTATKDKLQCARDWRWHLWCDACEKCIGHGYQTGISDGGFVAITKHVEYPPLARACDCNGDTVVIDTEDRGG